MSAPSDFTPFTNELKKRLDTMDHTNSGSGFSSHNSSLQVSPRGVPAHHHQPREGSIEADPCGWIEGTAIVDGSSGLGSSAKGVTVAGGGGSTFTGLKRLGGGTFNTSSTSTTTPLGGGYTAPAFAPLSSGGGGGSFMSTSGINMTPRGENGMGMKSSRDPNLGAARGGGGAGAGGGTANMFSQRNQPLSYGSSTDDDTATTGDDDDYDEDEEDDFDESDEESQEETDVLPKRFRPKVATGPRRGTTRGFGAAGSGDDQLDADSNLTDKAEFESFTIVTSLLEINGAATRRDLLEYHTPVHFLQFLEQLMCGAYFIRFYPRHGTPHERYVYLRMIEVEPGHERPFFCQCKHATAVQIDDAVAVSDLVGVVAGDDAPAFQRQLTAPGFVRGSFVKSRRPNFSTRGALSLYFWDRKRQQPRSLDILTTNMTVFRLWKLSCEALVAVNSVKTGPHAQSAAQVMRAYFLAAQRAIQEASRGPM